MLARWRHVIPLILVASVTGCTTASKPEHQSQTDPGTNLAAYNTFGWKSYTGEAVSDEPMRMLDVNIRTAIRAELTKRGYTEAETDAQFLVMYDTAAQEKVQSNPFRIGIGVGSWGSGGGGSVNVGSSGVESYRQGTLTIHVIDAEANKEVWYGTVSGQENNKSLDAKAVARAVAIAMQDFPLRAQ